MCYSRPVASESGAGGLEEFMQIVYIYRIRSVENCFLVDCFPIRAAWTPAHLGLLDAVLFDDCEFDGLAFLR